MIGEILAERYRLDDELGRGGIGIVYRAHDLLLERDVAVKVLDQSRVGPSTLERFVREARFVAPLTHPNIVAVYDASRAGEQPYIVMELLRGRPLGEHQPQNLSEKIEILRQICLALEHAHEHGIIHRDLKPGNIMIEPGPLVKIVDFGVAYHETSQLTDEDVIIGTVFYLSPEQALGRQITPQSDLYALGVVMYELLTGRLPFEDDNPMTIITNHLHTEVVPPTAVHPQIPRRLETLILNLLRKDPSERPASAKAVAAELEAFMLDQRTQEIPASPSTAAPPTVQSATLAEDDLLCVDREEELGKLNAHLDSALLGNGHIMFVTGSAGIGKTTLLSAFSNQAQARYPNLLVATGNCSAHSGVGDPYLPFREVLNMLTGDVEAHWAAGKIGKRHARRLIDIVPFAIESLVDHGPNLLESFIPLDTLDRRLSGLQLNRGGWRDRLAALRELKPRTTVDSSPVQTGFYEEYRNVLVNISRRNPLLIILDDLHWVDISSVGLLFHLARRITGERILIVGTYRPEDINIGWNGRPHPMRELTGEFGREFGDIWIRMETGDPIAGRRFVDALLDASPNPLGEAFRTRLADATGGHPLFTAELLGEMKARGDLVRDEENRWTESGETSWEILPSRVEAVIDRRLDRLQPELKHILTVAAVEGVTFTAEVISDVLHLDHTAVLQALGEELDLQHQIITEEAVRTLPHRKVSVYRFRHALFQRYLYDQVDGAQKAHFHLRVGDSLEDIYGEEAERVAVRLADHFSRSDSPTKAHRYLLMAGQRALRVSAYEEAAGFLKRAENIETQHRLDVDDEARGYRELMTGQALVSLSLYDEGRTRLENGLALLGRPIPRGTLLQALSVLYHAAAQFVIHTFPKPFIGFAQTDDEDLLIAAYRAYERLAEVSYFAGEVFLPLYTVLRILNSAETHGLLPEMARGYAGTGALLGFLPLHKTARGYIRRAIEISGEIDDPHAIIVVGTVSSFYLTGIGEWDTAETQCERVIELAERIGDLNNLMDGLINYAAIRYFKGDFQEASELAERVSTLGSNARHARGEAQGLLGLAYCMLHLNKLDRTSDLLETIDRILEGEENKVAVSHMLLERKGISCSLYLRTARYDEAYREAEDTFKRASAQPNNPTSYLGYTEPLEIFLRLWEMERTEADLEKLAAGALKKVRAFARVFPIGEPRRWLLEGLMRWQQGRAEKAHEAWQESLRIAGELAMDYDLGRTHLEIGRRLSPTDPARGTHLEAARDLFRGTGAALELAETEALIARRSD